MFRLFGFVHPKPDVDLKAKVVPPDIGLVEIVEIGSPQLQAQGNGEALICRKLVTGFHSKYQGVVIVQQVSP